MDAELSDILPRPYQQMLCYSCRSWASWRLTNLEMKASSLASSSRETLTTTSSRHPICTVSYAHACLTLSYVYIRTKSQNRCDSCTYIYVHGLCDRNMGLYRRLKDTLRYHPTRCSRDFGLQPAAIL